MTPEEKRQYDREYYLANRDRIRANVKRYRQENREKYLQTEREYYRRNRERLLDYNKKNKARYRNEHRDHYLKVSREWAKDNYRKDPFKLRCRQLYRNAVRRGDLVAPKVCSRCHKPAKRIEGHHTDYSKPFKVRWLCHPCHRIVEKRDGRH